MSKVKDLIKFAAEMKEKFDGLDYIELARQVDPHEDKSVTSPAAIDALMTGSAIDPYIINGYLDEVILTAQRLKNSKKNYDSKFQGASATEALRLIADAHKALREASSLMHGKKL